MKTLALADNCSDFYLNLGSFYPTGNAINFAVNFKMQGGDVDVLTVFGNDATALAVKRLLDKHGISYKGSQTLDVQSAEAIMDLIEGDRIHLSYKENVLTYFSINPEVIPELKKYDLIYSEKRSKVFQIADQLKTKNNILLHDFSTRINVEYKDQLLPYLDYAFVSYKGDDDFIRDYLEHMQRKGPRMIAMLGSEGSLGFDGNQFIKIDAIPTKIVNTVGAGDSYISAFAFGLTKGESFEECMIRGSNLACATISKFTPY